MNNEYANTLKITKVDAQTNRVYYINTFTKKGYSEFPDKLKRKDLYGEFGVKDRETISFYSGITYCSNLHPKIENKDVLSSNYLYSMMVTIYSIIFFASVITGTTIFKLDLSSNFSIVAPAAIFIYAFSFIFDAIITEVYNISVARRTYTIVGLATILMVSFIYFLSLVPAFGTNNLKFLFTHSNNILLLSLASLLSFFVSQYVNSSIISKIKLSHYSANKKTFSKKTKIMVRFLFASIFATLVDSILFCSLAFGFRVPFTILVTLILTQYFIKLIFDLITCYMSSSIANKLKVIEKTDVIEKESFSLFKIIAMSNSTPERKNNVYKE